MKLKEHLKGEAAKLKTMTFAQKREYIWEYYKLYFLITAFVLLIVYSFLDTLVFNPPKDTYLGVALYGQYAGAEICFEFEKRLTAALMTEEQTETAAVVVTNFPIDPAIGPNNMATIERFVAMVSARELDIIIATKEDILNRGKYEYLLDMSLLNGINYPLEDMLHSAVEEDTVNPGKEYPFGIPLKGTSVMDYEYYIGSDLYIAVMISSRRTDTAVEAINFILSRR